MAWDLVVSRRLVTQCGGQLDVRAVRAQVRDWVTTLGHPVDVDVVDLAVAEIATNAVRHTASGREGGGVDVAVHMVHESEFTAAHSVRVEITDDGGAEGFPVLPCKEDAFEDADLGAESGRGLGLVAMMTDRSGAVLVREGELRRWRVWFEVAVGAHADAEPQR
ncbi:ATP-binding protein [Actinomadura oligospora]|uniref:ATP-binding protein n=1 Tax=Actinomadura oligospora TaxID=111804 RepID=UPI0004BA95F8|nr:ATP-binding protein [Actinomadura oligospora]